jgi:flagellar assembly protein FliH
MNNVNVKSTATILQESNNDQPYTLGQFIGTTDTNNVNAQLAPVLNDRDINGKVDPVLIAVKDLSSKLEVIQSKVIDIENNGIKGRDLDAQLVQAMKDLKNYASFFEQAAFQMETKILKTSISIAQKVIGIEVGENSVNIAKQTIDSILSKIKNASRITIHLNPKDFVVLKSELTLEPFIILQEDSNVTAGGVVIASDMGNFDGNIEAKIETMLESLNMIA